MRPLDIIVCMKPVPDPKQWNKLTLDPETMLLHRAGIPAVINPLDRNAIEQAIAFEAAGGGTRSVVTMAPPDAQNQLLEALAMGCDRAFLLTDRAFAGADSLATARCLAAAIRKIGRYDLIFCGGYSLDGSTSQVGPQIAELLGIPELTHVTRLELTASAMRASCKTEQGAVTCEADLPALVTFAAEANRPRLAGMTGIRKAREAPMVTWAAGDLGLETHEVGLAGSPTRMLNTFTAPAGRRGEILHGTPDELAAELLRRLELKQEAQ